MIPDPPGNPDDYVIWYPGFVPWPCTVTVSGNVPDLSEVLGELSGLTGITFVPVPLAGMIDVRFSSTEGSAEAGRTFLTSAAGHFVHADVRLATDAGAKYGTVLRHELGHALGLGHAHAPAELMAPGSTSADYDLGDVAGLHALYQSRCGGGPLGDLISVATNSSAAPSG